VGNIRKKKNRLIQIIDELDIKAELMPLDFNERQIKKKADDDLAKLVRGHVQGVGIWLWALVHGPIQILKFSWPIHA
jgi:hypothetical protein